MLDPWFQRFRQSQPWRLVVRPAVAEQAKRDIRAAFRPQEEAARRRFLGKLEDFLLHLEADPLSVLGHAPLGTADPHVFRYSLDPQAAISVIADLDERSRELSIARIGIKVGGSHGHHGEIHQHPDRRGT